MASEALAHADLHWTWLHGDRQYAFVRAEDTSHFPWLTARAVPRMVQYHPHYTGPEDPKSALEITDPDGRVFDIRDPALCARLSDEAGEPIRLLRLGRGAYDAMPVSILTTTMVASVKAAHGAPVTAARFRANILIEPDEPGVTEQDWLGSSLAFGSGAQLHVDWAIPRCAMIGIDPVTAVRDAGLVRLVAQRFGNAVGAYCAVQAPGGVRVGDRGRLARLAGQ